MNTNPGPEAVWTTPDRRHVRKLSTRAAVPPSRKKPPMATRHSSVQPQTSSS